MRDVTNLRAQGAVLISVLLSGAVSALAAEPSSPPAAAGQTQAARPDTVFAMPAFAAQQQHLTNDVVRLFRLRRYADAEKMLRGLVEKYPTWAVHHYNLAASLARQDKTTEALARLSVAIDRGFTDGDALARDPDLASLRDLAAFRDLLEKRDRKAREMAKNAGRRTQPALVENGRAVLDVSNTVWERQSNTLLVDFEFPASTGSGQVRGGQDRVSALLNKWYARGEAAGNHGDLYDNRDKGHSLLPLARFPQMSRVAYGAEAHAAGVDNGVNAYLIFNAITLGNSSTAVTGRLWRSQARLAMTSRPLAIQSYGHYSNNHLYVFPEHRDHDPGRGDLFPANTPYMIISQGSSGSDRPFLEAIAAILAAFRPEVKRFLRKNKLVAPTVQMIFRSGLKSVKSASDYLSARAHPSVFEATDIDLERMIRKAHSLQLDQIPPAIRIAVVAESKLRPGRNYFGPVGADDILFDTPGAIARIVRSTNFERRMVVSAAGTADPNNRPLTFTWKVLRGDADRIIIKPLDSASSKVVLRVPWHTTRPVPFKPDLTTNRVDIAVFAHNGAHFTAPAFVSLYYPPNQQRRYDQAGRIQEIDYGAAGLADRYADPSLFAQRSWRDRYRYTANGRLLGWDRIAGSDVQRFTRHGAKVLEIDTHGRPVKAQLVRYESQSKVQGGKQIVDVPIGKFLRYSYRNAADLFGRAVIVDE